MNPETHSQPPTETRRKILVVDDNAIIVKTLAFKLKAKGYDVCTALDGATAVSTVRKERPDLILLDISFPPDVGCGGGVPWDGFLIIDWLRRIDEAKNTPIVVITGDDSLKHERRALNAGAVAFFRKPLDHDGLINVIRQTLGDIAPATTPGFDTAFTI